MLRFRTDWKFGTTGEVAVELRKSSHKCWNAREGWRHTNITDPKVIEDAAERCGVPIASLIIEEFP